MKSDKDYLNEVIYHMRNVQRMGIKTGKMFIEKGDSKLGRLVICNCFRHDISKLESDYEWEFLRDENPDLKNAIEIHDKGNSHHPGYWNGIDNMPEAYLIEMVIDWYCRSCEHGQDFKKFIETQCTHLFDMSKESHDKIKIYGYMLLLPLNDFGRKLEKLK